MISIEETSYLSSECAPTYRPLLPGPMTGLMLPSTQRLPTPSMQGPPFTAFPPPSPPSVGSHTFVTMVSTQSTCVSTLDDCPRSLF
ncbi:hypothetical protein Taro_036400 [Colocasia esculenta]|uniref:Uncharacterized protein n=1 Tax=Colocasia esculenta TaxID=4460 RepID=A0A843WG84_COLES|nr:hypothetical protein [Colocasia esculenta]